MSRFINHVSLIFHFYPAHDRAPSNFHSIILGLLFIHYADGRSLLYPCGKAGAVQKSRSSAR